MEEARTIRTAILVFANSSQEEVKHKAIVKGTLLFDILTAHTLETVEKTRLPYFHFTEDQQKGSTFGERFSNAIQAVYDKGYDRIITIGNDSPQLKPEHIFEAENQLKNNRFVLGPSADGGFYLMGLHLDQFNPNMFRQLAWQTSNLSKQLLDLVSVSKEVVCLETLFDIDTVTDIKSFIAFANYIPKKLLQILLHILAEAKKTLGQATFHVVTPHLRLLQNKGSPFFLLAA